MSDTPVNAGTPFRFEAGGVFRVIDGANNYVFKNTEPGSIEIDEGGYEPLNYTDRGIQQIPVEGDGRVSKVKVRMKGTKVLGAGEAITLGQTRDATTGLMKEYTVEIQMPTYKGSAVINKASFANCYFTKPVSVKTGEKFDMLECEFESTTALATWTSA